MSEQRDSAWPGLGLPGLQGGSDVTEPQIWALGESHFVHGMTLRERYAGLAMATLVNEYEPDLCAHWALRYADALIAKLAEKPGEKT